MGKRKDGSEAVWGTERDLWKKDDQMPRPRKKGKTSWGFPTRNVHKVLTTEVDAPPPQRNETS